MWGQREVGIAGVFVGQLVFKIISRKRLKSFMVTVFINITPSFRQLASDKARDKKYPYL